MFVGLEDVRKKQPSAIFVENDSELGTLGLPFWANKELDLCFWPIRWGNEIVFGWLILRWVGVRGNGFSLVGEPCKA